MTPETALEAIRARIRGEWDNPALVEFGPLKTNPNADILDIIASVKPDPVEVHARAMSDALLKVRPLGGSELFTRIGDEYFADAAFCGAEIDRLRTELHNERSARLRGEKTLRNIADIAKRNFGHQTEKLADIEPIAIEGLAHMESALKG